MLTTAMAAMANYERTLVAVVSVPSASWAQALRDPKWKGGRWPAPRDLGSWGRKPPP